MGNYQTSDNNSYDLVIDINKICDGSSLAWPVSTSAWLDKQANDKTAALNQVSNVSLEQAIGRYFSEVPNVVSIMGRFDRGKTFIINQLAKTALPSGTKVQTKGLSFLCPRDHEKTNSNVIYLDTAGTNSPLEGSVAGLLGQPDWRTKMANKKALEYFISDLQISLSDVILLVFNELTFNDQELLDTIVHRVQQLRKHQPTQIYVIHNYKDAKSAQDTFDRWSKYVLSSYKGSTCYEQTHPEVPVMTLRITGGEEKSVKSNIYHVCLADHNSNFGYYWNINVFNWLRSKLLTQALGARSSLTDIIISKTKECLGEYLSEVKTISFKANQNVPVVTPNSSNNNAKNPTPDPKDLRHGIDWTKSYDSNKPKIEVPAKFELVVEGNLKLRKSDVHFDGQIIWVRTTPGFEPSLDVVRLEKKDEMGDLMIIADLAGFSTNSNSGTQLEVKYEDKGDKNRVIVLQGERDLECINRGILKEFGEGADALIELTRERTGGRFTRTIPIPNANLYKSRIRQEDFKVQDGLAIIKLRRKTPSESVKLNAQPTKVVPPSETPK